MKPILIEYELHETIRELLRSLRCIGRWLSNCDQQIPQLFGSQACVSAVLGYRFHVSTGAAGAWLRGLLAGASGSLNFNGITMESQWIHNGITMESQWNHNGITMESQWKHNGITMESQWNHNGITIKSQWNHNEITRTSQ